MFIWGFSSLTHKLFHPIPFSTFIPSCFYFNSLFLASLPNKAVAWGWCCLWKGRGWCLMVLVWSWSLECAPKLSQCHFRELPGAGWIQPGVTVGPRLCSPILSRIWGCWWQNGRRNQGWAVPRAAPSRAGCEGWAGGFGVISCGFGVSWAQTEGGDSRSPRELGVEGIWTLTGE